MAFDFIQQQLNQQKNQSRYRQRVCIAEQSGREVVIDGKRYLNFSSNDYLALNRHPDIDNAMQVGIDKYGLCASASSLITGFHYAHRALEDEICQWLNKPKCLLFSSGFSANVGVLNALGQENVNFWLDKLSHASIIDGALSSKATTKRFLHNNTEQLSQWLKSTSSENNLIVSEGVFSMDGDQADIKSLATLAKAHQAWLYLDDAHSIGVIGDKGQGSVSQANIDIVMATFGKAIATSGAFVACEQDVFDYLVNYARHYIYSTAISPALAWATKKSIEIIQAEAWRRDKINELSCHLANRLHQDVKLISTASSIHAIVIGKEEKALAVCEELKQQGIWLTAIRPPTVPVNSSRLRITVCASHNVNDINQLADCLNRVIV
ncbi:aminotransferase class I/II-fold pyridoxal phosphate-dependent enzyme [Colwelliaceae bacterium 6471]